MKVVILAAGENNGYCFRRIFAKPKCLYSFHGRVQLLRVIEDIEKIGLGDNIRIVIGYKGEHIRRFLQEKRIDVELVENPNYSRSAIHSLRCGLQDVDEDVLLVSADQYLDAKYLREMSQHTHHLVLFQSETYPDYYILESLKIHQEMLPFFRDERYLAEDFLNDVRHFLSNHAGQPLTEAMLPPPDLEISSGWAMGFMFLDILRRLCKADKITGVDSRCISTVMLPDNVYQDLDYFIQTDEYQARLFWKICFPVERWIFKLSQILKRYGTRPDKLFKKCLHVWRRRKARRSQNNSDA